MKVSVITVCYNSASTIRTALESVFSQRGVDLEYIVVDGNSTDGTKEVIQEYAERAEASNEISFRWMSEPDRGMYDALNKGIAMATGDIVGILHSDDVFAEETTLSSIVAAFDEKVDAIYADIKFVRELGGPVVRYCSAKHFRPWMFRFAVLVPHPSFYCRRELFEKYGMYSLDYRICADFDLVMRFMWKHRIRTRYLNKCVVIMRMGGMSTAGLASNIEINREDLRSIRANGCWSALWLIYLKYLFKIWGFVFKK